MIVELLTFGEWDEIGEIGCECNDPACVDPHGEPQSLADMAENLVRGAEFGPGQYRVMAGEREVCRFTVGVVN